MLRFLLLTVCLSTISFANASAFKFKDDCGAGFSSYCSGRVAFSQNNLFASVLVTRNGSGHTKTIRVQKIDGTIYSETIFSGEVNQLAFSTDSKYLYFVNNLTLKVLDVQTSSVKDLALIPSEFPKVWLSDILPLNDNKNVLLIYKNGYIRSFYQVSLFSVIDQKILWTKSNLNWDTFKLDTAATNLNYLLIKNNLYKRQELINISEDGLQPVDSYSGNYFALDSLVAHEKEYSDYNILYLKDISSNEAGVALSLEFEYHNVPAKKLILPYVYQNNPNNVDPRGIFGPWRLVNENTAYGFVQTKNDECILISANFESSKIIELHKFSDSCGYVSYGESSQDGVSGAIRDGAGNISLYSFR